MQERFLVSSTLRRAFNGREALPYARPQAPADAVPVNHPTDDQFTLIRERCRPGWRYLVKISTILDRIDMGNMALPQFQRGYVLESGSSKKPDALAVSTPSCRRTACVGDED